jgi:hypothetical protein
MRRSRPHPLLCARTFRPFSGMPPLAPEDATGEARVASMAEVLP